MSLNQAGVETKHAALLLSAGFSFSFPSEYCKEIPVELSEDIKVWVELCGGWATQAGSTVELVADSFFPTWSRSTDI